MRCVPTGHKQSSQWDPFLSFCRAGDGLIPDEAQINPWKTSEALEETSIDLGSKLLSLSFQTWLLKEGEYHALNVTAVVCDYNNEGAWACVLNEAEADTAK